jgi:hypothetical protein
MGTPINTNALVESNQPAKKAAIKVPANMEPALKQYGRLDVFHVERNDMKRSDALRRPTTHIVQ